MRLATTLVAMSLVAGTERGAIAAEPEARAIVDRVAVRFFAPETGGPAHPRFISERTLAFEARLDAISDEGVRRGGTVEGAGGGSSQTRTVDDRHLRNAIDRHVAEELLSTLEESAGTSAEEAKLTREARADVEQRAGGDGPVFLAAEEEGLDGDEVEAVFVRRARAAVYLDRAVTRFLHPDEEQLREVFRAGQHPFHDRAYEDVRGSLTRWFVFERLKALESAFLQTARSRITVVVVPK